MDTSSEYTFPIFISSTDYNLKDLRAELARFLSELGYRPILSSAEGFPDSSPILEPWESCLPVLDKCFVMVLVIDGQYGTALKWPNYKDYFNEDKYSPTHGEYLFAHKTRKRMLVFIRKSLMPLYQSYRTTIDNCNNDKDAAKEILVKTLPKHVSFETLDFINMVKTARPIPWINEFDDITYIKKEVQKKMLNELAELFLIRNKHLETIIDSFNKVIDSLSPEEQKKALSKINATKEMIDAVEKLGDYKKELEQTKNELKKTTSTSSKEKEKLDKKIISLTKKITELENETLNSYNSQFFINEGRVKIGNPNYLGTENFFSVIDASIDNRAFARLDDLRVSSIGTHKCDGCGKIEDDSIYVFGNKLKYCSTCKRVLCSECWPINNSLISTYNELNDKCPKCAKSGE